MFTNGRQSNILQVMSSMMAPRKISLRGSDGKVSGMTNES